jgi:hypothetical protein
MIMRTLFVILSLLFAPTAALATAVDVTLFTAWPTINSADAIVAALTPASTVMTMFSYCAAQTFGSQAGGTLGLPAASTLGGKACINCSFGYLDLERLLRQVRSEARERQRQRHQQRHGPCTVRLLGGN